MCYEGEKRGYTDDELYELQAYEEQAGGAGAATLPINVAQEYARQGWRVFPVMSANDHTENWLERATTAPEQIEDWWTQFPGAVVGVVVAGTL